MNRSVGASPPSITRRSVLEGADLHLAVDDLVLRVEHVEELLVLIGTDGPLRGQDRRVCRADRHPDPHKHAGREKQFLIVEHSTQPQGAGRGVELVVDEIDRALVRDTCRPRRPGPINTGNFASRADFTFPASIKRRNRSMVASSTSK